MCSFEDTKKQGNTSGDTKRSVLHEPRHRNHLLCHTPPIFEEPVRVFICGTVSRHRFFPNPAPKHQFTVCGVGCGTETPPHQGSQLFRGHYPNRITEPCVPSTVIMVGNPPFGYRSQTAIDFITHAVTAGVAMVAMILPVSFTKYGVQHHLPPSLKLISSTPVTGFHTYTKSGGMKPYNGVRCVYQIWVNTNTPHHVLTPHAVTLPDQRIREQPATAHPDFTLWLYNCTQAAEKYFTYPWEFAVLRQGWEPMYPLFLPQEQLSRRKQWMLIKPHTPQARETLLGLDYNTLSENNTAVRGFGKADLITAYTQTIHNTNMTPQHPRYESCSTNP